ncbi:MAG TPA: hypothetical protein VJX47_00275 [Candidatus Sulfotelmatobacter sp.]|nr:hypothetical protein [Candidatus Sulfotelmatobacter sp.]
MTSPKKAALLVLLASLAVSTVGTIQAQQRKTTTTNVPRYTPPPTPRPAPRPEPEPQNRPEYHSYNAPPENRSYNNVQPEIRPVQGENHPSATAFRPTVVNPVLARAMTYNTRPGGIHIDRGYFATHYGRAYGFHFNDPANCCVLRGSEWYFTWNGGWFGLMSPFPGQWAVGADYLYIDQGDDGNYYLYDAQFPDLAIQLTFVQNVGDDQADAEQD